MASQFVLFAVLAMRTQTVALNMPAKQGHCVCNPGLTSWLSNISL